MTIIEIQNTIGWGEIMVAKYGYIAVKNRLLSDIGKGIYKEGDKLPTEREMCELFQVSRITVRQALASLENEGLIQRFQGRGTFVHRSQPEKKRKFESLLNSNYSFSEELKKQGVTPSMRVLSLTRIPAQPPLTDKLMVEPGHMIDVLLRLRLADDVPYAYETSYILSEYLNGATSEEVARDGLYNTMMKKCGVRPNKAVEIFEAGIAPEFIAEMLGRKGIVSVMQIERIAYLDDKPVEYCTSSVAGDKYRFRVKLE